MAERDRSRRPGAAHRPSRARPRADGGPRPRHPGARAGRPTSATSPAHRNSGWRAPARSRRSACWSAPPVRSTSTARWDEGIPEEIGHDHLYGLAWNPMTIIEVLKDIDGRRRRPTRRNRRDVTVVRPAAADRVPQRRDSSTARLAMKAARRIKTAEEIRALRGALAVAERGLAAAVSELAVGHHRAGAERRAHGGDGRGRRQHLGHPGRRVDHVARASVAASAAATAGSPRAIWWRSPPVRWPTATSARSAAPGRSARSPPGLDALYRRSNDLWDRLVDACRPGAPASDLLDRLRGGGRGAATDARGARPRAGLRSAGDLAGPAADRRRRDDSTPARCWPSRRTCGSRASARCSAATPS